MLEFGSFAGEDSGDFAFACDVESGVAAWTTRYLPCGHGPLVAASVGVIFGGVWIAAVVSDGTPNNGNRIVSSLDSCAVRNRC